MQNTVELDPENSSDRMPHTPHLKPDTPSSAAWGDHEDYSSGCITGNLAAAIARMLCSPRKSSPAEFCRACSRALTVLEGLREPCTFTPTSCRPARWQIFVTMGFAATPAPAPGQDLFSQVPTCFRSHPSDASRGRYLPPLGLRQPCPLCSSTIHCQSVQKTSAESDSDDPSFNPVYKAHILQACQMAEISSP